MAIVSSMHKQSVNLSCRIDKTSYDTIVEEARVREISMNSLINSILCHYVKFGKFSSDLELIPLTRETVKRAFECLSDKEIEEIANNIGGVVEMQLTLLTNPRVEFEDVMKSVEISGTRFGRVKHYQEGYKHNFNIRHECGKNFSKFLSRTHKHLADNLSLKFQVHNIDKGMVCMEIEKP